MITEANLDITFLKVKDQWWIQGGSDDMCDKSNIQKD